MSKIVNDPTSLLAARLRQQRETRGWSIGQLADRAGVSKGMISKIERGEASPTAALLGRLSGALSVTMSALLSGYETLSRNVRRADAQPLWTDPETGYQRRQVLVAQGMPLELVEVELPAHSTVDMPASSYAFIRQAIWVLAGRLTFTEGRTTNLLEAGDCLELGEPAACRFENRGDQACRYLVVVLRR
jgi:transcriptional regulator with XRE-family HTH domain